MNESKKITLIIIVGALMQFIASLNINLITVALPYISKDLGLTIISQNFLNVSVIFLTASLSLPLTKLLLKRGLKTSGKICLIITGILLIMSFFAPNSLILIISRLLQGGPIGILFILGSLIISLEVPKEKLGSALGILSASGYVGITIAPFTSGLISSIVGWRFIFLSLIPFLIIGFILLSKLDDEIEYNKNVIDKKGSLLWIFGTIEILYGLANIFKPQGVISVIIGIILMIAFYKYEDRIENPLFNVSLLKNKQFNMLNIMAFIGKLVTDCTGMILTFYLAYIHNIEGAVIGLILMVLPIGQVIVAPLSGKLTDKKDPLVISIISLGLLTFTMFLFINIHELTIYGIILILLLQSIGYAMFSPANLKQIITSVNKKDVNDTSGFLSNIKTLGQVTGQIIVNIIFLIIIGNAEISSSNSVELIHSIKIIYSIFLVITIIGMIMGIYIKHKNKELTLPSFKDFLNDIADFYKKE